MNIPGEHVKQKGLFDPFLNMFCEVKNNKQNNIYLGFLVNFASLIHGVLHAVNFPGEVGQNPVVLAPKMTFWVLKKVICCECMNIYEGYRVVIVNFARSGWLMSDLKPKVVKQKRPASPMFTFCHFASLAACLTSIPVFSRRILDEFICGKTVCEYCARGISQGAAAGEASDRCDEFRTTVMSAVFDRG